MSGQSFFIDTEGNLIKIEKYIDINTFAKEYCKNLNIDLEKIYQKIQIINPKCSNLNLSSKDLLVDILGYALYSYDSLKLNIDFPYYDINCREVTYEQINTIIKLLKINKESKYLLYNFLYFRSQYEEDSKGKVKKKNFDNNTAT